MVHARIARQFTTSLGACLSFGEITNRTTARLLYAYQLSREVAW